MKKIKSKNGFTLVECVVAMAVLAIMSLLLMMILNITVRTRNSNMAIERDIDNQVGNLMVDAVTTEARNDPIEFVQNAATIDAIPADGSDGIKANKIFSDGEAAEIDALVYNFDNYKKFEDIKKGGGNDDDDDDDPANKVYGSADTSTVYIYEKSATSNGDGTKTVVLKVSFSASSCSKESAVKIALPSPAANAKVLSSSNSSALLISSNAVRIEPTSPSNVTAEVSFTLTDDEYTNNYKSVKNFYEGSGSGSPAQLTKDDGSGEFKP